MRLARRIFFPNFLITASMIGVNAMMNSVNRQSMYSASHNANIALIGSCTLCPSTVLKPS